MGWKIEFDKNAKKDFSNLDRPIQKKIDKFIMEKLKKSSNPRSSGKVLQGTLNQFWRYRVGDYRLICEIKDKEITVLIIKIRHRKDVYKK